MGSVKVDCGFSMKCIDIGSVLNKVSIWNNVR